MNRVWSGCQYVQLTAGDDGLTHALTRHAYEESLATGGRRYTTVCGRTVLVTVPVTAVIGAPSSTCRACSEAARSASRL